MEMKHTTGPWKVEKAGKSGYWISAEENYPKCPVEPLDEDAAFGAIDKEQDAYAIAAVPEMIKALEKAEAYLSCIPDAVILYKEIVEILDKANGVY